MFYTLTGALMATGLNKTTIMRAIETGKIAGTKDLFGEWQIDRAELHRLYPRVAERSAGSDTAQPTQHPMQRPSNRRPERESVPVTCGRWEKEMPLAWGRAGIRWAQGATQRQLQAWPLHRLTSRHCAASSSLAYTWMPSTQK
jgi:hypothetical protein